jgi:hypothetical protein
LINDGLVAVVLLIAAARASAQITGDPFPTPIEAERDVVAVRFVEFATLPDFGTEAPRMMHLHYEPGTRRIFVSTMRGGLYGISVDGQTVTEYLDVNAGKWGIGVQAQGSERGFQSFVFHPQFGQRGARGYGRFYTYTDTTNTTPAPTFTSGGTTRTHDTVLLEWTAKDAASAQYDGGPPRELFRVAQPFANHNAGQLAFNPLAAAGTPEAGWMYVGSADGGSGGDPMNLSQNLGSVFGKILRIDPLGTDSANKQYGIPAANPFVGKPDALGEIYAYGVRNPQRFAWDAKTGRLFVADIGQNIVEEISPVTAGANLGWNKWEGSFAFVNRQVDVANPRSDAAMTWPIVEYDHRDPLVQRAAITGVVIYRQAAIRQLGNKLIFGDNPSGEIFYLDADKLPDGGQSPIRRILFDDGGTRKTLLQLIREKNAAQGKPAAPRADLRFGVGPDGQVFILNKRDGVIRLLVPDGR